MKHFSRKLIAITLICFAFIANLTAASFLQEYNIDERDYKKSPYYDQYTALLNSESSTYEDAFNLLNEWLTNDEDPEVYKMSGLLFNFVATTKTNEPLTEIPEEDAFTLVPDEENSDNVYFVYRDKSINFTPYMQGLVFFNSALNLYTNRFDIWDTLLLSYEENNLYSDEATTLIALIDFAEYMYENDGTWYLEFNEPLELEDDFTFDDFFYEYMIARINPMLDVYPDEESAQKVLKRLTKYFEDDSFLLSELGYACLYTNPKDTIYYCQQAYDLDDENYDALVNLLVAAYIIEDKDIIEEYEEYIYDSGIDEVIDSYEMTRDAFTSY